MPTLVENNSPIEPLGDEAMQYRRVLEKEIANHKLFSRVTVLTGLGLIIFGVTISIYLTSLATIGYLLVLVGTLRFLNTFYDLQRQDKLQSELKRLENRFARQN